MVLTVKQKLFAILDNYDITDEFGNVVFTVKGQLAFAHTFKVFDKHGSEVGMLKQKLLSFMPKYEIYTHGMYVGCIDRKLTFLVPKFNLNYKGWRVEGDLFEWDYSVYDGYRQVMKVSKDIFKLTDTYNVFIEDESDALDGIMIALAIDAEKCSSD